MMGRNNKWPFDELKIGQSFFVKGIGWRRAASIGGSGTYIAKKTGKKFSRAKADGGYNFKRTA